MKTEKGFQGIIGTVSRFFLAFLMVAFVSTCCLMLFVSTLQSTLGFDFTEEQISASAKITMVNVVLLSLAFAALDVLRRKLMIERPVKKITAAAEQMIAGDFGVRIAQQSRLITDDGFTEIIDCINKMAEELSGVETLRTDFIADVSHEMKTPLSVIQNYGTLLRAPSLTEEQRLEYATAVTDASRRLSDMMTNILKLNRLENQRIYPKLSLCNLGEQLCESLLLYEHEWETRSIEIETHIADEVFVRADAELLQLVWNNLLSNAFKFTDAGGRVTLSLTVEGEYAAVRVEDTGCGMTPEVGAHIFEKFYQGDTSRATAGNGLGLSLVRRVVDIMQGEISVESTVGVGTAFTVKLRRAEYEGQGIS